MSWSLNIGRVAGTVVRVHLTFLLFLAWIFFASYASGGAATAVDSLVFMLLLFLCVLLHEFGHIFTARAFGVPTSYVTLLPIGGVAQLERIPEEPGQEFLIAIAGPLVNVFITILLVVIGGATLQSSAAAGLDNMQFSLIDRLAAVNLFLALFNMIPAFPMDGGRVLRALLASRLGYVRATEIAAAIGQFVAFALGFIGLLVNPILIFIAIFVYLAASSEAHMVALRAASRGVPVSYAMMKQFVTLAPQAHLDEAVQALLQTGQGEFPVVDDVHNPLGVLGRGDLIRAIKTLGPDARVADAMSAELPTIGHRQCLDEAFKLLQQKQAPAVGVTDAAGRLVGLITTETIAGMMMVQQALPKGVQIGPWSRPASTVPEVGNTRLPMA
ncbi:MAG: site-2 protease family protein [Rhizobiales bacterium]|nr:site-2 protease family protein [Hyphomicrobiales bacterium]